MRKVTAIWQSWKKNVHIRFWTSEPCPKFFPAQNLFHMCFSAKQGLCQTLGFDAAPAMFFMAIGTLTANFELRTELCYVVRTKSLIFDTMFDLSKLC